MNRIGISHALCIVKSFTYRYPYAAAPKSIFSASTENFGPMIRPRKSMDTGSNAPTIVHVNVSSKSPNVSLHSVTVTTCVCPTDKTPAQGSNANFRPLSVITGSNRYSASISPRFRSSTSYWCTAPTKMSPMSKTSYVNTQSGPTATPHRVNGSRFSLPWTST